MKKIIIALFLLSSCLLSRASSLHVVALEKILLLEDLISQAQAKGIVTLHEETTVRTAEIFLEYANWDEANKDINTSYFAMVNRYENDSVAMAELLPDFERQDVIDMLDDAMLTITKLLNDEITRAPSPNVDWTMAFLDGDQITFEGQPVFISDYTWKPELPSLQEYHGQLDGYFIKPNDLESENTVKSKITTELETKPSGGLGFIFINHKNVPAWAETLYGPDFIMRENSYTNYDIDNPGARAMQGMLLSATVPYFQDKKYSELGYMLCNEPHFYTTKTGDKVDWASGSVSEYTFDKFRDTLSVRYQSIEELNILWGTSFSTFDEVNLDIPMDNDLQGTAIWYDWMSFNRDRVTAWFSDLKDTIQVYDEAAKVHLKIMPNLWSENKRGHGIDLEALTRLSELSGNDASVENAPMYGGPYEYEEHYAYDWRELCMGYDFMKSVAPDHPIINTENHFLSTGRSRDLYQNHLHARSTFFLGHLWGLTANQIWFWPRLEDSSPRSGAGKGYAGSNIHQPWLTNEIHTTTLDLNAHADDMMALQRMDKPIRIFFSETSALNKREHMDDVFELYEDLVFDGVPIGFVTEGILNEQALDWEVVCVYKTEFVTTAELNALQAYLDKGGNVVMDAESLAKDEYGRIQSSLTEGNGAIYRVSDVNGMVDKAHELSAMHQPHITLEESNLQNIKQCLWKSVEDANGDVVLAAVNVGKVPTTVKLDLKSASMGTYCVDVVDGVERSSTIILQAKEVLWVRVLDSLPSSVHDVVNAEVITVYPNPSRGTVYVEMTNGRYVNELIVFDMTGRQVRKVLSVDVSEPLNLGLGQGAYVLQLRGENNSYVQQIQIVD